MAGRDGMAVLIWVGAGVLVAAGAIMIVIGLVTPMGAASFGWYAYQPLADATFAPGGSEIVLSRVTATGCVILTVGLIAFSFLAGRMTSRRSPK